MCRAFRDLVDTTSLGYDLELHAAGLIRNTSQYPEEAALDELPMAEKTARIRRHRQAWRGLSFAPPVANEASVLYLMAPELRRFHPSGIATQMTEDQDLAFTRFPTPLGAQEKESWTIPAETLDIPTGIDTFAIDPAQDLLVIVWRMQSACSFFMRVPNSQIDFFSARAAASVCGTCRSSRCAAVLNTLARPCQRDASTKRLGCRTSPR